MTSWNGIGPSRRMRSLRSSARLTSPPRRPRVDVLPESGERRIPRRAADEPDRAEALAHAARQQEALAREVRLRVAARERRREVVHEAQVAQEVGLGDGARDLE